MRLPNARDLNEEQERVYLYAPEDGRVLVSGPPGTGKTVLAVLRAMEAARKGRRTAVVMFNRMLEAYACRLPDSVGSLEAQGIQVRTVRQLFRDLWLRLRLPPVENARQIILDVPYEEREDAKDLGARWTPMIWAPWGPRSGKSAGYSWAVESDRYWRDQDAFHRWSPTSALPAREDSEFPVVDWEAVTHHLIKHQAAARWDALSFDKLIVDEGQDFPPAFFRLLRLMSEGILGPAGSPLSVMVLADENQRLNASQNSTIADIETALAVPDSRHYQLRTNFRNTRQVALVAQHFFAGASTGMPLLPERRGPTPEMRRCDSVSAAVEQIVTYQRNNPMHEVGVLIPDSDTARRAYHSSLRAAAPAGVRVQTYAFRDPEFNQPKRHLLFDQPAVTVLNRSSCKGLEFDAVFIVNIQDSRIEEGHEDFFRMGMYVMSARARRSLVLLWTGRPSDRPQVLGLMPRAPAIRILA